MLSSGIAMSEDGQIVDVQFAGVLLDVPDLGQRIRISNAYRRGWTHADDEWGIHLEMSGFKNENDAIRALLKVFQDAGVELGT